MRVKKPRLTGALILNQSDGTISSVIKMELLSKNNEKVLRAIISAYRKKGWRVYKEDFSDSLPVDITKDLDQRIGVIIQAGYLDAPFSNIGYGQIAPTDKGIFYGESKHDFVSHKWLERFYGFIAGIATGLLTAFILHAAGIK